MSDVHPATPLGSPPGEPPISPFVLEHARKLHAEAAAAAAENERLRALVRDILQSMPDTADEQEWRDRSGALGVTDPDGEPYRAYTEDDL